MFVFIIVVRYLQWCLQGNKLLWFYLPIVPVKVKDLFTFIQNLILTPDLVNQQFVFNLLLIKKKLSEKEIFQRTVKAILNYIQIPY